MAKRLAQYETVLHGQNLTKVGPKGKTPPSLAARMPSAEIAAKVGITDEPEGTRKFRIVRRNARIS